MARVSGYLMAPDPPADSCDCAPPANGPGRTTSEPCGTVWLCEHKRRGWEVCIAPVGRVGREWRELTGGRLRRARGRALRRGYKTDRETWAPSERRPTLPPPVEP